MATLCILFAYLILRIINDIHNIIIGITGDSHGYYPLVTSYRIERLYHNAIINKKLATYLIVSAYLTLCVFFVGLLFDDFPVMVDLPDE